MISALEVQRRPAMKKNNTQQQSPKEAPKSNKEQLTIGIDVGDKTSRYCVLDSEGKVMEERAVATTKKGVTQAFGARPRNRIALEVGTHSGWLSRLLKSFGHEVIVANTRQVKLISASTRKDDRMDAQMLARLARVDPALLRPIRHRSEEAQADLLKIRVRAALVETRTSLVNALRGFVKTSGHRLPSCDADTINESRMEELPAELQKTLKPLMEQVESLTEKIQACTTELEQIARSRHPETELLIQISGVGTLIALTFVLTVEDPARFAKSRDVGCYVGLRPKRSDSGKSQPELRISKEGDSYLRKMLVQGAHYILGHRGPDPDLKRWGLARSGRGKKNAKKRAIVAVARKLGILLHRLWVSGEVYEPLRNSTASQSLKQATA
jgi:transposase